MVQCLLFDLALLALKQKKRVFAQNSICVPLALQNGPNSTSTCCCPPAACSSPTPSLTFQCLRNLPGIHVEVLLAEVRCHDSSVCELSARQCGQCLCCARGLLVLEINLTDAIVLSRATGRPRHLDLKKGAVLSNFFLHILKDFCEYQSAVVHLKIMWNLPSASSGSINSSGVIMFIRHKTLPVSPSLRAVPATMLNAFTLISPLT